PSFISAMLTRHRVSPLFPYTTLFRSRVGITGLHRCDVGEHLGVELKLRRSDVLLELRHCRRADDRRAEKPPALYVAQCQLHRRQDRKSTRLNSSHQIISYAVFCLKKK